MPLEPCLQIIQDGKTLSVQQMHQAMRHIMNGEVSQADMSSFLSLLASRGETAEEITGAAMALREKSLSINAPSNAIDCCGTGGDGAHSFNVSTAVALVAAACGVPMAKHGNRSASSKSGAADVLEELGVNLDMDVDVQERALLDLNFCFMMAPKHHKAMKHVAAVRKALGIRTIFNLIGPLANPAGTACQLVGVFDRQWLLPMAEALRALGTKRAIIVHGHDGLDEITVCDKTSAVLLSGDGSITERILSPDDFGVSYHDPKDLTGGDAVVNAAALRGILSGEKNAYRDIVIVNSAAVLSLHHNSPDYPAMARLAAEALDNGAAAKVLDDYITLGKG